LFERLNSSVYSARHTLFCYFNNLKIRDTCGERRDIDRPISVYLFSYLLLLLLFLFVGVCFVSPIKRLNKSRCRLGKGLRWDQGTIYRRGPDPPPRGGAVFGDISFPTVQHIRHAVDILNLVRLLAAAMRPFAVSTVAHLVNFADERRRWSGMSRYDR